MAEPARVYDESDEQPVTRPKLEALEDGGQTTEPKTGHLSVAGSEKSADASELSKAEKQSKSSADDQVGNGYSKEPLGFNDLKPSSRSVVKFAKKNRGKVILGGAALGVISLLIIGFLILIPFKILHVVNNLQDHFFATSNDATERMVERTFQTYLQKHVLPATRTCGSTINPACRVIVPAGGNPVTALYRGWSQARFEKKLAERYGVVFGYDTNRNIYYMNIKGAGEIDISDFATGPNRDLFNSNGFRSTNQFREAYKAAIRQSVKDETRWKQVLIRFKANRLVRLKTGLPACVFLCGPRDDFRDWRADQKTRAFKLARVSRVLAPRDEMTRILIECMFDRSCDLDLKTGLPPDIDTEGRCRSGCDDKGKPITGFETRVRTAILNLQITGLNGTDKLRLADERLSQMQEDGTISRYLARRVIASAPERMGTSSAAARQISGRLVAAIPIVGWILFLASLTDTIDYVADNSGKVGYIMNSTTMAGEWQSLVTLAHECKEGRCDAAALGSAVTALGPCLEEGACDVGGVASAEQSPVYGEVFGEDLPSTTTSLFPSLFSSASAQTPKYTCGENDNPQPLPAGKLACPEERLDQQTDAEQVRDEVSQIPGYSIVTALGGGFNYLAGRITSFSCSLLGPACTAAAAVVRGLVNQLPGIDQITAFMGRLFSEYFMPKNPTGISPSGGRELQLSAGGASWTGAELAHNNLGGSQLTQPQVNVIVRHQKEQQLADYKNQPMLARLFDTESSYSPIAYMARATPSSFAAFSNRFFGVLSKDIPSHIASMFSLVHLMDRASLKVEARDLAEDPFGITQYGYLSTNPIFSEDPELFYQNNCMNADRTIAWNATAMAQANGITGQPENLFDANDRYHGTNPCLLIWSSVGSAGAIYTDDVLSDEEIAEQMPPAPPGGGGPVDCNAPPNGIDQSPGTTGQMGDHADLIISSAPGLTCPDYPKPSGALPADPGRQYFSFDGCSDGCQDQGDNDEAACEGAKKCIKVQYRNPPLQGDTRYLCYESC